jgi:hypothetical protein
LEGFYASFIYYGTMPSGPNDPGPYAYAQPVGKQRRTTLQLESYNKERNREELMIKKAHPHFTQSKIIFWKK